MKSSPVLTESRFTADMGTKHAAYCVTWQKTDID